MGLSSYVLLPYTVNSICFPRKDTCFLIFFVGQESTTLTTDSDRDIQAHCCANCVDNLATVVKHSFSCHGSVPNSFVAAVTDKNIVLIQAISEFHGVGICG